MKTFLMNLKKRLYVYVILDFLIALLVGYLVDFSKFNLQPIGVAAVFIMLYPMLTGMVIEKVKKAGRNFKLIFTTLTFAYVVAS